MTARDDDADWALGHGKIILLGEHGVVHGRPALAAGLPRGCVARVTPAEETSLRVLPWGVRVTPAAAPDGAHATLRRALHALLACDPLPGQHAIEARLDIPSGAGLGASAALSVAIARALDAAAGRARSPGQLVQASLAWEREFHGNPSGVDSTMAVHGGVSLYRRGEELSPVGVGAPVHLVVGHSGQAPSTADMVASVARQLERSPDKVGKILDGMEAVVLNGRSALAEGNLRDLGQLMELNQKLLNSLLLSTTGLEEMCNAARAAGALGAKLTGGGGGGCMIALADGEASAQEVAAALRGVDPDAFVVRLEAT